MRARPSPPVAFDWCLCTKLAPFSSGAFFMRLITFLTLLGLAFQAGAFPWYASGENIRGAQLMSPDERKAHVARLQAMQTFGECKDYMQVHYLELDRRALERRVSLPPVQGDPCEVMRTMGRLR